jgi:hypothetical protein
MSPASNTPIPIQAIQLTPSDMQDPTLGRLNNLLAQITQAANASNGSTGRTQLPAGVDVAGSTVTGLGAPQNPSDAVSAEHVAANYSAASLRAQLDIGGPQALKGLTLLAKNAGKFADAIVPGGVIDGANTAFTLPQPPSPALSLCLYLNGVWQQGGGVNYTLSGAGITLLVAPPAGQRLIAFYRY